MSDIKPKLLQSIKLTGKQIDGRDISCTGNQLIKIIRSLERYLINHNWYIADISANHPLSELLLIANCDIPLIVGSTESLIELITSVDQFLSGIFLCVPNSVLSPTWSRSFDTEDEPASSLDDALIEVRAFDTTYFEIFTSESEWLKVLLDHFPDQE